MEFSRERALLATSRAWHPSQTVERAGDGRVRIAMRVPSLVPVVSWILEWGPHARAVAPDALVDQVKSELTLALKLYA